MEISREDSSAHSATIAAMKAGSDIVYQARLSKENEWGGWADFLIKRNGVSSKLGNWSYEVLDTKLATETRAGTILQIALYSEAVGEIQGKMPSL